MAAAREPGDLCGAKPCWKQLGTSGYGYIDPAAAQNGIKSILFKSGAAGKGLVKSFATNNEKSGTPTLPAGVVGALSGNVAPTVQMIASGGLCVSATLTDVPNDNGVLDKASK